MHMVEACKWCRPLLGLQTLEGRLPLGGALPAALGLQAPHSVRQSSPDAQRDLQGLPGQGF